MKRLIRCPDCWEKGIKQNLAEVISDKLVIQRTHKKEYGRDYTIIDGDNFSLTCGNCGNLIFYRRDHEK